MAEKRFVILRHECPYGYKQGVHWDLMLEESRVLRTWALSAEPVVGQTISAEQLADHRLAYLDYEGPISGDRGVVSRWDCGSYELLDSVAGELCFLMHGNRLSGRAVLTSDSSHSESWTFHVAPAVS